jgi:hypothetical protein
VQNTPCGTTTSCSTACRASLAWRQQTVSAFNGWAQSVYCYLALSTLLGLLYKIPLLKYQALINSTCPMLKLTGFGLVKCLSRLKSARILFRGLHCRIQLLAPSGKAGAILVPPVRSSHTNFHVLQVQLFFKAISNRGWTRSYPVVKCFYLNFLLGLQSAWPSTSQSVDKVGTVREVCRGRSDVCLRFTQEVVPSALFIDHLSEVGQKDFAAVSVAREQ